MFFQGSLQDGISSALQQSKFVVCFVTDNEEESRLWEDEFLMEDAVKDLISTQSVCLRLEAGSQEEGFLAQLYPLPKKPTVVIIKSAELREYLAAGTTKEDFISRIQKALQPTTTPATQPAPAPAPAPLASAEPTPAQPRPGSTSANTASSTGADPFPSNTATDSTSSSGQASPASTQSDRVNALLAERAARLEAKRKKDAEEAAKQRKAKAEADAQNPPKPKSDSQAKHAQELRKRQREAKEERQRILKAIEDDKAARRARLAERQAERQAAAAGAGAEDTPSGEDNADAPRSQLPVYSSSRSSAPSASSKSNSPRCNIQVRLFDGATMRNRFASDDTLGGAVRAWVDEASPAGHNLGGGAGYTFKVLLAPAAPNRAVDVTEEGQTLRALGLTPSATLLLEPVRKRAAGAYPGEGNVVSRFLAYVMAFFTGSFGVVFGFFSTMFSTAGPPAQQQPVASNSSVSTSMSRVKAQRRPAEERRDEQQFYNGNSTNFEPRHDEDGENEE